MTDSINTVLLAAGKGTRLKINIAKPLCPLMGRTLVDYVIDGLEEFSKESNLFNNYGFVIGHQKEEVQKHIENFHSSLGKTFSWQKEQLGTGHALQTFFNEQPGAWSNKFTIVVCADTPLIDSQVYEDLYRYLIDNKLDGACASFTTKDPKGYGRIIRSSKGFKIVEEKDSSIEEKKITEVNSALYIFKTDYIKKYLYSLSSENKSNEFYLTDLFRVDNNVQALMFKDDSKFIGVNNLVQLAEIEKYLRMKKIKQLQLSGVRFLIPESVYIEESVKIASGSIIHSNTSFYGKTTIGSNVEIESGAVIKDSIINAGTVIKAGSCVEKSLISNDCSIGPMARLREGSEIGSECKIGNFVETKKVNLSDGVKISHLSYLGDAEVGKNTNIGCGFVTCNYDGKNKHMTKIGENSFIGSDCQVIAPISLGSDVYIGSGSTINKDVPDGAFAIARQRQVNRDGMAHKFLKKK